MRIIVDTNIVFSAILNTNSRIAKILLHSIRHFHFYSCDYLRIEINQHRNKLLKLTKLSVNDLTELENIVPHNITFIDEHLLPQNLFKKIEIFLKSIDLENTSFIALTKHLKENFRQTIISLYRAKSKTF